MRLVKEVYASWRAEVVFITSNLQGNQELMEGCMEAGIPAFVSSPGSSGAVPIADSYVALGNAVGLLMSFSREKDPHTYGRLG